MSLRIATTRIQSDDASWMTGKKKKKCFQLNVLIRKLLKQHVTRRVRGVRSLSPHITSIEHIACSCAPSILVLNESLNVITNIARLPDTSISGKQQFCIK